MAKCKRLPSAPLMAALLSLPGCALSENPAEGGLLGGLNGLVSGAYDGRVVERQARLDGVQQENYMLASGGGQLEGEAADAGSRRRGLRAQLVALDGRTAELTARTRRMRADTDAERRSRADIDARLRRVRTELDRLRRDVEENKKSADAAERERLALEYEMDELAKVADALR